MSKRLTVLVFSGICLFSFGATALADEPLKGSVDETAPLEPSKVSPTLTPIEPMAVPVVPAPKKKLQGNVEHEGGAPLEGRAADDDAQLQGMEPQNDKRSNKLQGNATLDDGSLAKEDPDAEDQELAVQWDIWRNRFLNAVQSGVQETLNNPDDSMLRWDPSRQVVMMRFPLGTAAWFSCRITNDQHIADLKLMRSSGFPNYDKAVLAAVSNLDGSALLRYPKRSRRRIVTQIAGIKTSDSSQQQFFHFGDVERIRVPAGQ